MRPATKKRLRELGFKGYRGYCLSDHWKARRALYWATHPKVCAIPGCRKRKGLHLHHVSYANLLCERDEDLIPLCSSHHRGLHTHMRNKRVKLEHAFDSYVKHLARKSC